MMKRSVLTAAVTLFGVMTLAACAGAFPGGLQKCAGINEATIAYDPDSGQMEAALCGGKENESVKLSGKTPAGLEFIYEAQGARAFAGQMTQAEFAATLGHDRNETIRAIIDAIRPKTGL